MWKKPVKRFILSFVIISGLLTALWKIISIPYLYLLVFIAKPIWSIFNYPVQLAIEDKILKFVYTNISTEPISFSVFQADEIYLNLVLLVALFVSTWIAAKKHFIGRAFISLGILFVFHEIILFAYSYTNIWEYVKGVDNKVLGGLINSVNQYFPGKTAEFFDYFLFHWNAWGWDVLPLILWLISTYKFMFKNSKI